ncbi:MAG: hypothetical protein AAB470_00480 [Patescibacteria group bacterium]
MFELTTGVIFLVSSLYGSGQSDNHIKTINANKESEQATTTQIRSLETTNSTSTMKSYLHQEYAEMPILVEIARCESEFRQFDKNGKVVRGLANPADVGLMQINEFYHADTARNMGLDIHTVEGNVAFAKYLYGKYGSSPWSASASCWSKSKLGDLARK